MTTQHTFQQEIIHDFWLRLDNAAKIYPVLLSKKFTAVFRMSAILKQRVQIKSLLKALRIVEKRFPYYKMQLKKGFFWYYLEHNNIPVSVRPDDGTMCSRFEKKKDHGLLLRVLVHPKTIHIEFSHILTDGAGALEFFKSLLITYFAETGVEIPEGLNYVHPGKTATAEEVEDAYHRYFKRKLPPNSHLPKAFHLPFSLNKSEAFQPLTISLKMDEIKAQAKSYPVSVTVYLIAVYLCALQELYKAMPPRQQRKNNKLLRIQVPINLRNILPSRSMRNFTLFVLPEIDLRLGYYSFAEIIKKVHHYMELEKDEKMISRTISRNVGIEKNKIISSIPLEIKRPILQSKYYSLGANLYSGELTNIGKVDFSPAINKLIDSLVLVPPPPNKAMKIDCAVIGFNDKLVLTFGNITTSQAFEQRFLQILKSHGISYQTGIPG